VWLSRRGSRSIEHVGSAHDEQELAALKAAAAARLALGQAELDLGLARVVGSQPLPIMSSRMSYLWDALCAAYETLGFDSVTQGDSVFRDLVLARIIEPTSKADALRVLAEVGVNTASYATVKRRLPIYAQRSWRQSLAVACAGHAGLGPASLVLYDVSSLHFETDVGDGFREPGFSKERRLEPQITLGLLTDATGFPLMVEAFEGNRAETATMLPVINAFKGAHQLSDVTVVADAGMISEANQSAIQAAGLSFILGTKIPRLPQVRSRRKTSVRRITGQRSGHRWSRWCWSGSTGSAVHRRVTITWSLPVSPPPQAGDRHRGREQPGHGCQAGDHHSDAHPTQADLLDRWADHAQRPGHGRSRPPRRCELPTLMQNVL
jgi:hypothetical protein